MVCKGASGHHYHWATSPPVVSSDIISLPWPLWSQICRNRFFWHCYTKLYFVFISMIYDHLLQYLVVEYEATSCSSFTVQLYFGGRGGVSSQGQAADSNFKGSSKNLNWN
jgi:hypothetical protein